MSNENFLCNSLLNPDLFIFKIMKTQNSNFWFSSLQGRFHWLVLMIFPYFSYSKCCGGSPRVLADEAKQRNRIEKRGTCYLWVCTRRQSPLRLLRDSPRRLLLRKLPELSHQGRGQKISGQNCTDEFSFQWTSFQEDHWWFHWEGSCRS